MNFRELRKQKGITQTFIARQLGVSNNCVSFWEKGRNKPSIAVLPRLAEILNVSLDELIKSFEAKSH